MQFSFENIKRVTEGIYPELVKMRRHLHSHPELGREEFQTSEYLKQKIREVGSLKLSEVGSTGFCADLITNKKKPWLALKCFLVKIRKNDWEKLSH